MMLLRLIAIVVLLSFAVAGCTGSDGEPDEQAYHKAMDSKGILSADDYRVEIEALEAILYKEGSAELSDQVRMTAALMRLHGKAIHQETDPVKKDAAQRVMFLASRADMRGVGYSTPDLASVRADWEQVRFHVFGEREWFKSSTPELAQSQEPAAAVADPIDVSRLGRVVERLEDLIGDGRDECEDLGEPVYEPTRMSAEGEEQVAEWAAFYRDWDDRLNYIADRLPSQPPWNGSQDFSMAYQSVGQAMNELRLVPSGVGDWATPFRSNWESRFDQAERKLAEARGYLDKL